MPTHIQQGSSAGGGLSGTYANPTVTFSGDTLHVLRAGDTMSAPLTISQSGGTDLLVLEDPTNSVNQPSIFFKVGAGHLALARIIASNLSSGGIKKLFSFLDASSNNLVTISSNDGGRIGVGLTYPSAKVHVAAGTTAANTAPIKFDSGTAMTTPEPGAIEYDGGRLYHTNATAIRESFVGAIFTQTADATVTNTAAETSIIGSGVGTTTLPANFLVAGKTIRIRVGGIYSTPALATPSVTIKIKYGSTVLASVTTSSLLSGASNLEFDGEALIICRSTGSSGTVVCHGDIEYATGVAGTIAVDPLNNAGAATTINTTTSNAIDVTVSWDSATSSRSAKSIITTVEIIN